MEKVPRSEASLIYLELRASHGEWFPLFGSEITPWKVRVWGAIGFFGEGAMVGDGGALVFG